MVHRGIEHFDMPEPAAVRRAAEALRMLGDPTRVNILWALMQGETSVACLAELAGTSATAVSQHLSKLRLAGLVTNRREGAFVIYALADEHVRTLLRQALTHADCPGGHRTPAAAEAAPATG
ncbi:ArsR/SmtB family transcription factor [Blastococcus saxobsidens]|uniref:ArsR/SmtB family transcription factor n=1 Tax=Blastococcus saxobsidens TaxID=138336 RepID=UPI001F5F3410|nr:metalloregulator ArsR/SmtB family transcription factor [Blastococcus saxobsidens]